LPWAGVESRPWRSGRSSQVDRGRRSSVNGRDPLPAAAAPPRRRRDHRALP
jgi:hypothetical protein